MVVRLGVVQKRQAAHVAFSSGSSPVRAVISVVCHGAARVESEKPVCVLPWDSKTASLLVGGH